MESPSLADPPPPPPERMWQLDLGLIVLGGLIGYTLVSHFRFDDPRLLYNAWTYVAIVVLGIVSLSILSRWVASRFIETSAQLGFLASILVHLLLLMMAVNVIVFGRYFPDTFSGTRTDRVNQPKTVPDYLFTKPPPRATQPDWAQPVLAEASSRSEPVEPGPATTRDRPITELELPQEQPTSRVEPRQFSAERSIPAESLPMPADSPGQRSRNNSPPAQQASPTTQPVPIEIPQAPAQPTRPAEPNDQLAASSDTNFRRPTQPTAAASMAARELPDGNATAMSPWTARTPLSSGWVEPSALPNLGESASVSQQAPAQASRQVPGPVAASPAAPVVPLAGEQPQAERSLATEDPGISRTSRPLATALGLDLEVPLNNPSATPPTNRSAHSLAVPSSLSEGTPGITAGKAEARDPSVGRGTRSSATGRKGSPLGPVLDLGNLVDSVAAGSGQSAAPGEANPLGGASDRLTPADTAARRSSQSGIDLADGLNTSSLPLELPLPSGMGGLANQPANRIGMIAAAENQPRIGDLAVRSEPRRRAAVGGPMQPAGAEIATPELFRRRTLRTDSGGMPSPATSVGPETEEAIERGLQFLAARQAPEGHWSLQGHGEPVLLRSDTAATGLCLLAFQGAGYTHQKHRYAPVVSRGLEALLAMQRPDGNLYRSEDRASDQSVAFYSHGIAALALCEAYGMSRDESLRGPAQRAIDYIVQTQHHDRGGWRYQPQVSSDTSVSGWMMMALKSGELAGLRVPPATYEGIDRWLEYAKLSRSRSDLYRYNPFAPNTPAQAHGREVTPSMTAVAILMRMYSGWRREDANMRSAADYLLQSPPQLGDRGNPLRDTYYWYYATQVMFHMGGEHWQQWNAKLKPLLIDGQVKSGPMEGSWDPVNPVPDRWSVHAGRLYLTTLNLLSLEVYYRHLPIYDDTGR